MPVGLTTNAPAAQAATVADLALPPAGKDIERFNLHVPQSALNDLRRRLAAARLPDPETVEDVSQGVPLTRLRGLVEYWRTSYDWRALEARLNRTGQYRTQIDGLGIHFLHVRSKHPNALPVILNHGWPGSFVEFLDTIGPLTDPTRYGGSADDAFHVVIPSMPGYGFSDRPTQPGWDPSRIAAAWGELMRRLGYHRYIAQGGDWGGAVTTQMAKQRPNGLIGVHLNLPEFMLTNTALGDSTPEEQAAIAQQQVFAAQYSGYFQEQATRPQTLGYGLADSPTGQAAWIYEKFIDWTDSDHHPERVLGYSRMLDDITLYWLTNTGASSARLYWEFYRDNHDLTVLELPVGVSVFPAELVRTPKVWAEKAYKDLVYFNDDITAGGHFAAFEQPRIFADELRAYARLVR
ncbi:epoxide hydrolase family protein [Actinacidiphila acididurans]|uniref:Epoxide hydrolase n=1 Tax=Actinacidiphila acididurans TaxID=2784346 RepID=A0ABS2TVQ4_9ACTN|nr:epoxide hydrolase family protein [Actinacidiphila acididurans]MBM9506857.1 epoxide hydrolase [Actinacidiphila acididurans]